MTEQEKVDLEILKRTVKEKKIACFDYLCYCKRMSVTDLQRAGYKSNEAAIMSGLQSTINELTKLTKDYFRKYPD